MCQFTSLLTEHFDFLKKEVINEKAARLFRFLYWTNCLPLFTGETIRLVVSNHAIEVSYRPGKIFSSLVLI